MNRFYVYHAYGVSGELLYVGKGSGERYKHCSSGVSSKKNLNRYYFQNGEGECITTSIVEYFDTEVEALCYEKYSIELNRPTFNSEVDKYLKEDLSPIQRLELGYKVNFRQLAENYYEAKIRLKGCEDSSIDCTVEDINSFKATIETTEALCKRIVEYVNALGLDVLKSCGFQESKIKRKYEAFVGVNKLEASPKRIQKHAKLKPNSFVTFKEAKDVLQKAYNVLGIKETAKANHLERYYPVKRCKRDGVMGYLIIDEKQTKEIKLC